MPIAAKIWIPEAKCAW